MLADEGKEGSMTGRRQTTSPGRQRIIEVSLAVGILILLGVIYTLYGFVPVAIAVLLFLLGIGVRQLDLRNARPILMKEMRSRMRGVRASILLLLAAGAAVLVALLIILPGWDDFGSPETLNDRLTEIGQALFTGVTIIIAIIVALVTPALASGAIAHEYETQTFDFLIITPLSEAGILSGKLLAAMSFAAMLVVCTLPITALAFFFGGVAPWQFFAAPLFILIIAYCLGAISLYCSARFRKVAVATSVAYMLCITLLGIQMISELIPYELGDGLQIVFGVVMCLSLLALFILGILTATSALLKKERAQRFYMLKRMLMILIMTMVLDCILSFICFDATNATGANYAGYGSPAISLLILLGLDPVYKSSYYSLDYDWPSILVSIGGLLILTLLVFRKARYIIRCQRVQPPRPDGPRLRFRVKPW